MRKYILHILYAVSVTQVGSDFVAVATPLLAECSPSTLQWTVTPSTPFVFNGPQATLLAPEPGTYELHAIDKPTCQALTTVVVEATTAAKPRR